jgi:outer membrane protein
MIAGLPKSVFVKPLDYHPGAFQFEPAIFTAIAAIPFPTFQIISTDFLAPNFDSSGEGFMKKLIMLISFLFMMFLPAISFASGVEFSIGAWYQQPSGDLSFDKTTRDDDLDLEDDLGFDDKWQPVARLKIDMPRFIPNIYLMYTAMKWDETGSKNVNFSFGGQNFQADVDYDSELEMNHLDAALYYGISGVQTATANVLNIDLGLNVRMLDFKAEIEQDDINQKESEEYFLPIPMLFAGMQIEPLSWIALDLEGRGIAYSNNHYVSLIGKLKVMPFGPLYVAGGYRYDNVKIDYQDVDLDADFKGPFGEIGLEF